jgi:hypothetical protein
MIPLLDTEHADSYPLGTRALVLLISWRSSWSFGPTPRCRAS